METGINTVLKFALHYRNIVGIQ